MKNTIFLFLVLFIASDLYAQDDLAVVIAVKETHEPENNRLVKIESNQLKIIAPTGIMSLQTAKLAVQQQNLFKSLYKVYDVVENLQIFLKIIAESDVLIEQLEKLYDISRDRPEAMLLAASAELTVTKESVRILADLFRATQQSKFNIMNSLQRLELAGRCLDSIVELQKLVRYMYLAVENTIRSEHLTQVLNGEVAIENNFDAIYAAFELRYAEIFPENIREE